MQQRTQSLSSDYELELRAEVNTDFEQQYLESCLRDTIRESRLQSVERIDKADEKMVETSNPESALYTLRGINNICSTQSEIKIQQKAQSFIVFFYVKQFLERLQKSRTRIMNLSQTHFNLIGDKASDYQTLYGFLKKVKNEGFTIESIQRLLQSENTQTTSKLSVIQEKIQEKKHKIQQCFETIIDYIPLVHPETKIKMIWDYSAFVFRLILLILIPLQISFNHQLMFDKNIILTSLIIFALIFDMMIRANTICFNNGCVIKDRWEIMRNYLKSQFFRDLLCILILLFFTFYPNVGDYHNLILLVVLDQYKYIYVVYANSDQLSYLSRPQRGILGLFKLISTLLQILHIYSCIWFWISKQNQDDSWIVQKQLEQSSWGLQYLESLYFAVVTMLTIGYGDNVPKTSNEKIAIIVFILVACVWFSYSVNFIGNIINDITQNQVERNQKMRIINKYMNERNIPYGLQHQIKEYLTYRWKEDDEVDLEQEQELLQQLSDELKEELDKQVHKVFIEKSEVLKKYFTNEFRVALFKLIKRKIISPQNIFNIEFNDQLNLCYIEQGSVLFQHQEEKQRGKMNAVIRQGEFLCVQDFISDNKENLDLFKAIGYVSLLVLSKQDFINTLKDYPEDYQRYCQLKDNSQFNQEKLTNSLLCPACLNNQHNLENCPYIQFMPDRELVVKRSIFNQRQTREPFQRKLQKDQFMTLLELDYIQEFAMLFQQENHQLITNQLKFQNIDQKEATIIVTAESPSNQNSLFAQAAKLKSMQVYKQLEGEGSREIKHQRSLTKRHSSRLFYRQFTKSGTILGSNLQEEEDGEYSQKNIQYFNKEQQDKIIVLYERLQKESETDDSKDLKFYLSQLEPLYQKYHQNEVNNFEALKQFDFYFPNQNCSNILRLLQKPFLWETIIINKFTKYLFYPFDYILKYLRNKRSQNLVKEVKFNPVIQRVKNKLRMVQLKQSLLTSRNQSFRNAKPSQITPLQSEGQYSFRNVKPSQITPLQSEEQHFRPDP